MRDLCRQFESRLDAFVAGALPTDEHRLLRDHADTCSRCAALLGVVLDPPPEAGSGLVAAVLETTSGSGCRAAHSLLCDWTDGRLAATDSALVEDHLRHCPGCTSLAAALQRLTDDLPRLAEHAADVRFVDDVLRLTSAAATARTATPGWRQRLRQGWESLSQRPRFAWEVAWLGTAILVLLVGTPQSPLRHMPQDALAIVQTDPTAVGRALHQPMERTWEWMRDDVEGTWEATGGRVVEGIATRRDEWGDRHPRAQESWQSLQQHMPTLRQSIADGNLAQASWVLTEIGGDIKNLWHGLRADPVETPGTPNDGEETP